MIAEVFSNLFLYLNNSKLFSALIMIIMNLGTKYISMDLNIYIEKFLSNYVIRKIAFFAIIWMATKDIFLSICLTFIFSFLIEVLLNEKSKWCILPKKEIFLNKYKNPVSKVDYDKAKEIIQNYEGDRNKQEYFSHLYERENKKKEHIYIHNKSKLNKIIRHL